LGRIPVNALGVAAFGILGFAQPAFWVLGMALEAAVVPSLAFNARFQKLVQADDFKVSETDAEQKRNALVAILEKSARQRLSSLIGRCDQITSVFSSQQLDGYVFDSNNQALKNLQWVYLKLLVARHHLLNPLNEENEQTLGKKIQELENDLAN